MNEDKKSSETKPESGEDILAETEIYLAYQMADQAIAVLEEALGEGVGGLEHRVRLIEIYAAEGNMDAAREHAVVAFGQLGPDDEGLRARIVTVEPEWSLLQASVVETSDAGAAELVLVEEPEPTASSAVDVPPAEDPPRAGEAPQASGEGPGDEKAADNEVELWPPAIPLEPRSIDSQDSRRSWHFRLLALGVLVGVALVFVFVVRWPLIESPSVAGLPQTPVQGEAMGGEAVQDAAGRAAEDGSAEWGLPEFGTATQMVGQVFFREGSTEVGARFDGLLDEIAGTLVDNPGSFAEIVGYPIRTRAAQLDTAFARQFSRAVANQLIQRGVVPDRLLIEVRTGADLVADGWVIDQDYNGMAVIHLGGPLSEGLP